MISNLQARQEYLLTQMDEERERWECERNGWDRMGEALVRRRTKPGPAPAVNPVGFSSSLPVVVLIRKLF